MQVLRHLLRLPMFVVVRQEASYPALTAKTGVRVPQGAPDNCINDLAGSLATLATDFGDRSVVRRNGIAIR